MPPAWSIPLAVFFCLSHGWRIQPLQHLLLVSLVQVSRAEFAAHIGPCIAALRLVRDSGLLDSCRSRCGELFCQSCARLGYPYQSLFASYLIVLIISAASALRLISASACLENNSCNRGLTRYLETRLRFFAVLASGELCSHPASMRRLMIAPC